MSDHYQQRLLLRRKVFKFVGAVFQIYDESGSLRYYVKQKGFQLREDIRLYSDESMTQELLLIKARQIIDFSAAYDVTDSQSGQIIGALRRKGLKSMFKDEWMMLDANGEQIGVIAEDNAGLALLRRTVTNLIPQTFIGKIDGQQVLQFKQKFNPFIFQMQLDFTSDVSRMLDQRLGIAAAVLLAAIEGRQSN